MMSFHNPLVPRQLLCWVRGVQEDEKGAFVTGNSEATSE
jgi:hypothetical protein